MSVHELWGFIKYIGMGKQSCAEKRKESMTEQRTQRIILIVVRGGGMLYDLRSIGSRFVVLGNRGHGRTFRAI